MACSCDWLFRSSLFLQGVNKYTDVIRISLPRNNVGGVLPYTEKFVATMGELRTIDFESNRIGITNCITSFSLLWFISLWSPQLGELFLLFWVRYIWVLLPLINEGFVSRKKKRV